MRAHEGRALILHFIFTHCVAACHRQVRDLRFLRESLPADTRLRVQFLSVSLDPAQDTPEALRRYAQENGITDAAWRFATAPSDVIDRLTQALGVQRQPLPDGQIDHTLVVFLFDAKGRLIQRYTGAVDTPRLVRTISDVVRLFDSQETR